MSYEVASATSSPVTLTGNSEIVILVNTFHSAQYWSWLLPTPGSYSASLNPSFLAYAAVTTGTGVSSLTARIRRGTDATGVLCGVAQAIPVSASSGAFILVAAMDNQSSNTGEQSYCFTLQQGGARIARTVQ